VRIEQIVVEIFHFLKYEHCTGGDNKLNLRHLIELVLMLALNVLANELGPFELLATQRAQPLVL